MTTSVREWFKSNPLYEQPKWRSVFNSILNTGVRFSGTDKVKWLAGFSNVPSISKSTPLKEHMFMMHDMFHQLFPVQCTGSYTEQDRIQFKKSAMAGEVVVLYITEFLYAEALLEAKPEYASEINERKSTNLHRLLQSNGYSGEGVLDALDNLLYEYEFYPSFAGTIEVEEWINHYWPMLEFDRHYNDINWSLLKEHSWQPMDTHEYSNDLNHKELGVEFFRRFQAIQDTHVSLSEPKRRWKMRQRLACIPDFYGWRG